MTKIKRVSLFFRIVFQVIFLGVPIFLAIAWINAPRPLNFGFFEIDMIYRGIVIQPILSNETKILGFLVCIIPTGLALYVLYCLIKLFRLYEQGTVFSLVNVQYLRNIGYALLIGQIVLLPLYEALISVVLSWHNPHGYREMIISVQGRNLGMLLTGLLVILISWIMAEACKLQEDHQLTI
ncbi:MAG: hypothetical protein A3E87_02190 [Gammaproteobacteria bacterium RIFCSPHIGHO2_12_FULL_35_23]|nr:MAG: hypothetical protein A3E87_02190 [Gammaproteobacteria bacterium RIFCSPHIGHO2_12_FULL_35_23]